MSINRSSSSLPPQLQAQFDDVVDLVIVETVFPTLLIPIGVSLLMFTKPEIQRKPVFILNVFSVMLGLIFGSMAIATVTRSITGRAVSPDFITALTGLYFFIPLCVQCILFVRIFAVYPPRVISRLLAVAIYGTLLTMTLARVVNIGIALKKINETSRLSGNVWAATTVEGHVPSLMAELCMALAYDIIASGLFLFRLRQASLSMSMPVRQVPDPVSNGKRFMSYPARVRALFWIALTNFVFPVVFNTILLIFIQNENFGNIITVIAVSSVNVYVQIISVLLATLWCSVTSPEVAVGSRTLEGRGRVIESISTVKFPRNTLPSYTNVAVGTGIQVASRADTDCTDCSH
ncbi:hypothetical protein L227DRAFT_617695 [Lentinus tigrinus ALCF2SS1-6]|uniref:Uncharacterized protein n=1 Tax=Lentinus tigrinus ALCF2SS1-6 TaxID=1328759 RepID=A0A5C2RN84_9APHY|nr:hypothetical protein L227DRAFT_617695 [Lentinus tigrinus ALCF2SS1-6]